MVLPLLAVLSRLPAVLSLHLEPNNTTIPSIYFTCVLAYASHVSSFSLCHCVWSGGSSSGLRKNRKRGRSASAGEGTLTNKKSIAHKPQPVVKSVAEMEGKDFIRFRQRNPYVAPQEEVM